MHCRFSADAGNLCKGFCGGLPSIGPFELAYYKPRLRTRSLWRTYQAKVLLHALFFRAKIRPKLSVMMAAGSGVLCADIGTPRRRCDTLGRISTYGYPLDNSLLGEVIEHKVLGATVIPHSHSAVSPFVP